MNEEMIKIISRYNWLKLNLGLNDALLDSFLEKSAYLEGSPQEWRDEIFEELKEPKTLIERYLEYFEEEKLLDIFAEETEEEKSSVRKKIESAKHDPRHLYNHSDFYEEFDDLGDKLIEVLLEDGVTITNISNLTGESKKYIRKIKEEGDYE